MCEKKGLNNIKESFLILITNINKNKTFLLDYEEVFH